VTLLDAAIAARLPFGNIDYPATQGELLLFADGTVQMLPSMATIAEFEAFTGTTKHQIVAWGSSLIVGFAAVGCLLWLRGKRGVAWSALGASGVVGILSGAAQRQTGQITRSLLGRHRLGETASVQASRSGGITFTVREPNQPPWSITLAPEEMDSKAAETFLGAIHASL
jgi:uncharacterized membrane protein